MIADNEFSFEPFFQLLAAEGIKVTLADYGRVAKALQPSGEWTLTQMRGVLKALLVKTPDQEKTFDKCFDDFFSQELPEPSKEAIAEFRRNPDAGVADNHQEGSVKKSPWEFVGYAALVLIAVFLAVETIVFFRGVGDPSSNQNISNTTGNGNKNTTQFNQPLTTQPSTLQPITALLMVLSFSGLTLFVVRRILVTGSQAALTTYTPPVREDDSATGALSRFTTYKPQAREDAPRVFALSQVGSERLRLLSERALNQLSGSLKHAMIDQPGKRLDLKSSISESASKAGLLSLVYQHIRIVKGIYVMVDTSAESLRWNSTARELASGLSRRGVQVNYAEFYGSPESFRTESGTVMWLESLEESRNNSILFIFSDGKQLDYGRDRACLEALSRWPFVAWLDLREPKFWDESARLIRKLKIPLFPASESGLMNAAELFLTERGANDSNLKGVRWRGAPAFVSGDLEAYVESLLGDALPWAQACAMMQPLPLKLANTLRTRFTPELPLERIERLFRLPGTWCDASGLQFSKAVLAVLRSGFTIRWDEREQVEILNTIIDEISSVEPPEKDSLRHLAWEYALERVRLELDPDAALPQLIRLLDTSLGTHVRAELAHVLVSDASPEEQVVDGQSVPLRKAPETSLGRRQLQHIIGPVRLKLGERFMRGAGIWWQNIKSYRLARLIIQLAGGTFELLINFPYQKDERDGLGYFINYPNLMLK